MLAEYAALRKVPKRTLGDLYDADEQTLSGTQLPADPLVPLGYERKDTIASLAMLAGNIAFGFVTLSAFSKFDRFLFKHRIANIGLRRGSIAAAMVLWDFLYYWDHRWMHEVRLLWANHVSHHSGERYNLSTALRQPWSGFLTFWVFAPMPLLGFPTAKTAKAGQLNLLYQYWIHTEAIDRLPAPVEKVFNTPSHHRGHHGANRAVPRQELRRDPDPVGQAVRHLRAGGAAGEVRPDQEHPHLQPAAHRLSRDEPTSPATCGRPRGLRRKLGHVFGRPGWTPAVLPCSVAADQLEGLRVEIGSVHAAVDDTRPAASAPIASALLAA